MRKKMVSIFFILFTLGCLYYMSKGLVGFALAYVLILFNVIRVLIEVSVSRVVAERLNISEGIKEEIPRKVGHILIHLITFPMIYYSFKGTIHVLIFLPLAIAIFCLLIKTGLLEKMVHRDSGHNDNLNSALYSIIAFFINMILALYNPSFTIPCLLGFATVGLGDPCACLVGKKFGKHKIYKGKTLEGVIGFVIGATISMYIFSGIAIWKLIPIAISGAIAELFSNDYDNMCIQLVVCLTAFLIL